MEERYRIPQVKDHVFNKKTFSDCLVNQANAQDHRARIRPLLSSSHDSGMPRSVPNAWKTPNEIIKKPPAVALPHQQVRNHSNDRTWSAVASQDGSTLFVNKEESNKMKDEFVTESIQVSYYDSYDDEDDDDEFMFGSDLDDDDEEEDVFFYEKNGNEKGHEKMKKSKYFRKFFEALVKISDDKEINLINKEWHCPACKGSIGAIDWYRLDPLIQHAQTKKVRRVKLHRLFAQVLLEELRRQGISTTSTNGEASGVFEGLDDKLKDYRIVWPPMVMILNTRYEQEENGKWVGMGNQELLHSFNSYSAVKAKHSYGPQGHRGISVLIFEATPAGYLEAVRLHKHFSEQRRDRKTWDLGGAKFVNGKRQLYGFLATEEDLNNFNKHSKGRLKFEMRSYRKEVENEIGRVVRQDKDFNMLQDGLQNEQRQTRALAESVTILGEKLYKQSKEHNLIRERIKVLHEENKEEMEYLEQFFKERINELAKASTPKDNSWLLNMARDKNLQDEKLEEFNLEGTKMVKKHEQKKAALMMQFEKEILVLEEELRDELDRLIQNLSAK